MTFTVKDGWITLEIEAINPFVEVKIVVDPKEIPLNTFVWHKHVRMLTCEASQLIDYSIGDKLLVKSHVTGRTLSFDYKRTVKNKEGEYVYYVYEPEKDVEISPIMKVLVFND